MLTFGYLGRTDEARIPMPLGWGVSTQSSQQLNLRSHQEGERF